MRRRSYEQEASADDGRPRATPTAPAGGRPETIARKLYSAVAATIAARIAGIVVNRIWVKATGKKPPTDTKSPDVKWTEAVAWTALVGNLSDDRPAAGESARGRNLGKGQRGTSQVTTKGRPHACASVALLSVATTYAAHSLHRECLLRGALSANHLAARTRRELAAVMHQEATRTGELVCLPWEHPQ